MLLGFTNAAISNQVVRSQISHVAGWIPCWHDIPAHFCDRIRFVALGGLCACQVVKFFVPLTKIWCAHAPTCPWKKFITSAMDTVTGTLTHCTLFHSIVGRGSEDSHNKDCTFRFRTHRPWPLWAAIPGSSWPSSAPRQRMLSWWSGEAQASGDVRCIHFKV